MTNDQLKAMNARCDNMAMQAKCFRKVIASIDPIANNPMTDTNIPIKVLADWGRRACDTLARTDLPDCLKEIERLQEETKSFKYTQQAVSKIWKILGIATYKQAKGKSVDQLVQDKLDEIERLRGACRMAYQGLCTNDEEAQQEAIALIDELDTDESSKALEQGEEELEKSEREVR